MEHSISYKQAATRIGWGMAAFFLVSQLVQGILVGILKVVSPELVTSMAVQLLLSDFSIYCIGFPVLVLICKRLETQKQPPVARRKMSWRLFYKSLCMAFAATYAASFLYSIVMEALSSLTGFSLNQNALEDIVNNISIPEQVLLFCIIPPILEELVFRKYLYSKVGGYGHNAYILVSGLCFGLFHGNLNQFVYAFALGALFAWMHLTTGKVIYGMAMHAVVNLVGSVIAPLVMENDVAAGVLGLFILVVIGYGAWIFFLAKRAGDFAPPSGQPQPYPLVRTTVLNSGMMVYILLFVLTSILSLVSYALLA